LHSRACLAVYGSFWLGAVIGALEAFLPLFTWNVAFGSSAALCIVVCFLGRRIPESPRWLVAQGRTMAAERIVAGIEASLPHGRSAFLPITKPVSFDTRLSRLTLINVCKIMCRQHWRTLLLCFIILLLQAFVYNSFCFSWMDVLVTQFSIAATPAQIGSYLLPIALANFLARLWPFRALSGKAGEALN
jgi:MFS transporter, putative metabolite:H+ symporter